ncbi:GNAT family N-acetyltransferase [Bacillus massiliglaciei]|uniref:GNAT family N-acetyltransferase n=1 Tax=Bacillus massiliglaciei TaxID=1816693 RepID=UPI000DA6280F|nr:GNAT family N-acetyltransferase [Bacillus massiliglaciei]
MIVALDTCDRNIAEQILAVQTPAYQVEAELIGFNEIPALKDTVDTIVNTEEIFIGWMAAGKLKGVLSYLYGEGVYQICRLTVHPQYFRQGIASNLLYHFLQSLEAGSSVWVSTGSLNIPAINLYKGCGFLTQKER